MPDLGAATDAAGLKELRLPPGAWRIWAYGSPGTAPTSGLVKIGVGGGAGVDLALRLGVEASLEFEVPVAAEDGEVAVFGPRGAYLKAIGPKRYRIGGLGPKDRAEVYLLCRDGEDEEAVNLCGRLVLTPGRRKMLELVKCATLRARPLTGAGSGVEVRARDLGTARGEGRYSLSWALDDFESLTESLMGEEEPQVWLREQTKSYFAAFDRAPGRAHRVLSMDEGAFVLRDLFPGHVDLEFLGSEGLNSSQGVELTPGEERVVELR
ncbi:MAG: hypothetical protein JKY65_31925 [Planctomycetes bacterium]|nr:hypothetical protein [Planctomycetota bacterium]